MARPTASQVALGALNWLAGLGIVVLGAGLLLAAIGLALKVLYRSLLWGWGLL